MIKVVFFFNILNLSTSVIKLLNIRPIEQIVVKILEYLV